MLRVCPSEDLADEEVRGRLQWAGVWRGRERTVQMREWYARRRYPLAAAMPGPRLVARITVVVADSPPNCSESAHAINGGELVERGAGEAISRPSAYVKSGERLVGVAVEHGAGEAVAVSAGRVHGRRRQGTTNERRGTGARTVASPTLPHGGMGAEEARGCCRRAAVVVAG